MDSPAGIRSESGSVPPNLAWLMKRAGVADYDALHAWSVRERAAYWQAVVERLGIVFRKPCEQVLDVKHGVEHAEWFRGARLNIVESCFQAPMDSVAIVQQREGGAIETVTVGELAALSDRVAGGLVARGCKPGDAIAVLLPLNVEAVAVYLGILKAGCVVVSIADSFRAPEIATRLKISKATLVFTQDYMVRGGKKFPLYQTAVAADAPAAIVIAQRGSPEVALRNGDCPWTGFLKAAVPFDLVLCGPSDPINILFSSGTTGDPKAIAWTQITPLKCVADAHFHQLMVPGDVVVWPTSMGWMMGPWLIFSTLINRGTIGLFDGSPLGAEFAGFVEASGTTLLGVTPSLVKAWRGSGALDGVNWNAIQRFSTTGECSAPDDMRWLMDVAGGTPVIEYCGGTELAGGYITSTVCKACPPSSFNTPTLGLDFVVLDEAGQPAETGEVFLIPPGIGLSTELLNGDHHAVYYADLPAGPEGIPLRRHGDLMEYRADGTWRALGRADDTMNLGGIKVGSAEIERVVAQVAGIADNAAVAVSPDGGPSLLVIFAVVSPQAAATESELLPLVRKAIREELNPLFKVHALFVLPSLPRTASNKVMRRVLRDMAHTQIAKSA
jgi:acetyl-CoA synthetase